MVQGSGFRLTVVLESYSFLFALSYYLNSVFLLMSVDTWP